MIIFGSVGFIITFLIVTKVSGIIKSFFGIVAFSFVLVVIYEIITTVLSVIWPFLILAFIIMIIYLIFAYISDRRKEYKRVHSEAYIKATNRWNAKLAIAKNDLEKSDDAETSVILYAKDISNERADEYLKGVKK